MMLPTRLISLAAANTRMKPRVCLVSSLPTVPAYLTLSHCWGGSDILRVTTSTVEDFSKELSFEKLPRTFQDALEITRRLGYSYYGSIVCV